MRISIGLLSFILLLSATSQSFAQFRQSACRGGYSGSFTVTGEVENPETFNFNSLSGFSPQTADNVLSVVPVLNFNSQRVEYTGALLWEVVNQAGLINNSSVKNDADRKYVLVTGSDCKRALFSMGELDPTVGGGPHQIIVAFELNGQRLALQGFAQIVSPGDKTNARWIQNITNIEVIDVVGPTPSLPPS
jgi:hypothetical protein